MEVPSTRSFRVQGVCFSTPCPLCFPAILLNASQWPDAMLNREGKGLFTVRGAALRYACSGSQPLHP